MKKNSLGSRNLARFKKNRLAVVSLILLTVSTLLSFASPLLCNDKPLILKYGGNYFFPAFKYYPSTLFEGEFLGEPNYKELQHTEVFQRKENWMFFPLIRFGPNENSPNLTTPPPTPPTKDNWLGTDDRGRDLLTRLIYGFRNSISFALISWFFVSIVSYLIGGIQGYWGGKVDLVGQRLTEIWTSLPILYVIIFLISLLNPSLLLLTGIWVAFGWVSLASYVRAEVLKIRKMEYVLAARAVGNTKWQILVKHILPNALTPLLTFSPFIISGGIGSLAALDYLGLGLPPPTASWGELLRQGKENLRSWWLVFFPVFSLFFTLLLLNFVGEGVRQAFDVKE